MTKLTRKALGHISEDLLAKLLKSLTPIPLDEDSTQWHIGYHCAQRDFRYVLEHQLNAGPLPEATADPHEPYPDTPVRKGFLWWK